MKPLLSGILISTMLLSTFSVSSALETPVNPLEQTRKMEIETNTLSTSGEEDFSINEVGVLTSYKGKGGTVVIPSTIQGQTVTAIAANVFKDNTSLESVTIPSTVKRIESSAFSGCGNLRIVELSEGLEYIGDRAFASTTALSLIWFPSTLSEIGAYAFDYSGLTSVYVPITVRTLGEYAFQNCLRLESAIFIANVTILPRATFYNCVVLEEVYLREGIEHIGRSAFNRCTSLKQITLPTTTTYIGEFAFYGCSKLGKLDFSNTRLETVDYSAFQNCVSLTEAVFPYGFHTFTTGNNSMQTEKGQFIGCTSLKKVVLPSTVSTCYYRYTIPNFSVGLVLNLLTNNYELLNHPFIDCNPSLVVYGYEGSDVAKLASYTNVFSFSPQSASSENTSSGKTPAAIPEIPTKSQMQVVLPVVDAEENNHATSGSEFVLSAGGIITSYTGTASHVEIPSSIDGRVVYGIGSGAFQGNTTMESVTLPRTLERIESSSFSGCTSLHTVNLNEGLQYIGVSAFASTTSLQSIWFPSTLVELAEKAFEKSGLTSLYVPETVRIMGEYVFQECPQLRSVILWEIWIPYPELLFTTAVFWKRCISVREW